jgi:hypothetical protein
VIQTFTWDTPAGELLIERDLAEVNVSSRMADETWHGVDSNGHEHRYADERDPGVGRGSHYPTLIWVPGPSYYCPDCRDEHEDYAVSHYECRLCGEAVEPGAREPRNPEAMVLTRVSAYLGGQLITKERAETMLSEIFTAERDDGATVEFHLG